MKNVKDELQHIILGDGPSGAASLIKNSSVSLEQMRKQVVQLKNSSASKVKKQQHL